jgi:hypothetical protein
MGGVAEELAVEKPWNKRKVSLIESWVKFSETHSSKLLYSRANLCIGLSSGTFLVSEYRKNIHDSMKAKRCEVGILRDV